MVTLIQYVFLDDPFQITKIDYVARFRIRFTANGYFQNIVVPVPVGVVAFSKGSLIPFVWFIRIMESVGRIKMGFSCYVDQYLKFNSYRPLERRVTQAGSRSE